MNKLLLALTAGTAVAIAAPAAAQWNSQGNAGAYNNSYAGAEGVANRIDQLEERLEAGIDAGVIDRTEARNLRQQLRQLNRLEAQYSVDGLTQQERRDLQQRIRYTRQQLRAADGDARFAGWNDESYYDRDFGNDRYGNNDRYGGYANVEQVNEVCARSRVGIGTILGRIFGTDNCLRVGERVTTQLSSVPTEVRGQVPTRSGYRYGYVEGNVVEFDSRTGVVTRIYATG